MTQLLSELDKLWYKVWFYPDKIFLILIEIFGNRVPCLACARKQNPGTEPILATHLPVSGAEGHGFTSYKPSDNSI